MNTLRKTAQLAILGLGLLLALPAGKALAQGNYNDNRYNNNYNDGDDYDGSYQDFYDALSPYGEWINDPNNGYVWVPDVDQSFRPYYTNGYWAMTEYGNTWVSNYNWGWATFHYGRWTFDEYYGWVWIPGNEWAPAWVNWRNTNNGYYGWAPLGPGGDNYYSNDYYGNSSWWVFAPQQYIYSPNIYNYVRSPRYNNDYLRRSTIIRDQRPPNDLGRGGRGGNRGGIRYFTGPSREDVQRAIGRPVTVLNINNSRRAGATRIDNNKINIFRPNIRVNNNTSREIRPAQVQTGQLRVNAADGRGVRNSNDVQIPIPGRIRENRNGGNMPQQRDNNTAPVRVPRTNSVEQGRAQEQQMRDQRAQQEQQQRSQREQQVQQQQQQQQQQRLQIEQQQRGQRDQQVQQQRAQQEQQQRMQREQQVQQQRAQQDQQRQQRAQQEQQQRQVREQQVQQQRAVQERPQPRIEQQQPQRVQEQPRVEPAPQQEQQRPQRTIEGGGRRR